MKFHPDVLAAHAQFGGDLEGMQHKYNTERVLDRMEILLRKLDDEGRYVSANTAALAIDEIKRLSAALKEADGKVRGSSSPAQE